MADSLPDHYPAFTLSLTDASLISILPPHDPSTDDPSQPATPLKTLQTASKAAYTSTSRLSLGQPQRIMIETSNSGPVLLHSYITKRAPRPPPIPRIVAPTEAEEDGEGGRDESEEQAGEVEISAEDTQQKVSTAGSIRESMRSYISSISESLDLNSQEPRMEIREEGASEAQDIAVEHEAVAQKEEVQEEPQEVDEEEEEPEELAPMLIGTMLTPSASQNREAKRAVASLESLGSAFQKQWIMDEAEKANQ